MPSQLIFSIKDAMVRFKETPVFKNLTLNIHQGKRIALIGKNGAGKSTIMNIISGVRTLDDGEKWIEPGATVGYLGQEFKFKMYRGMASSEVHEDYHGGLADWKTAEGVSMEVEYRETEEIIIADIVGGLRSGMTYAGAASISELQRKLDYVRITNAARIENLPHRTMH